MSAYLLEALGQNEFLFVVEILHQTADTGESTSTCCASGTRD